MMEVKQAVEILNQAIDMSVAAGAFKASRDVTVVNQALQVVAQFVEQNSPVDNDKVLDPGPVAKMEKVTKS